MQQPLHSRPVFEELRDVIGTERLMPLLDRFIASLRETFAREYRSGEDLAREAHTLVSMSGMLGCERLSAACRTLEAEAKAATDLTQMLARIRRLRDETVAALEELSVAGDRAVP